MLALNPQLTAQPNPALNPALSAFSPDLVTRLLTDALTALGDIARSSANPIERRRAATTLLRFITARPPRTARNAQAVTPRANPTSLSPATPAPSVARTPDAPPPLTPIPPTSFSVANPPTPAPRHTNPSARPRAAHTLLSRVGAPPH